VDESGVSEAVRADTSMQVQIGPSRDYAGFRANACVIIDAARLPFSLPLTGNASARADTAF
jgi:hypothetical protein